MSIDIFGENEIKIGNYNEILKPNQFVIGDKNHKNTQQLFLYVLKTLIEIYNKSNEVERAKEGVFYLKEDGILLGNIKEEVVQNFKTYKELFNGLMSGENLFYKEYDPKRDDNRALSVLSGEKENPFRKLCDTLSWHSYETVKCEMNPKLKHLTFEQYIHRNKKIEYNLNHFSFYFNGLFFEHIATETFFKLIDDKYNEMNNNIISLLPRIMFYEKDPKYKNKNNFGCYSEIDCAFVLKGKELIRFEQEKITCFANFAFTDEYNFYNKNNFVELEIEKDNVVILEIKSRWERLSDNKGQNKLITFINKAMKFVDLYRKLNLVKKHQKIVLIYLYDNSMHFDVFNENENLAIAYAHANRIDNLKLYIAYFQPYLKIMNSYDRVKKLRELNQTVLKQQADMEQQKKEMKKHETDMEAQKNEMKKQKEFVEMQYKVMEEQKTYLEKQNLEMRNKQVDLEKENKQLQETTNFLAGEIENMKKKFSLYEYLDNIISQGKNAGNVGLLSVLEKINEMKNNTGERPKSLEQSQIDKDIPKNNEKDNNLKGKKYSVTSIAVTLPESDKENGN